MNLILKKIKVSGVSLRGDGSCPELGRQSMVDFNITIDRLNAVATFQMVGPAEWVGGVVWLMTPLFTYQPRSFSPNNNAVFII